MRVHSGEKPFACTQCDYSASHNSNLKAHMLHKHSGQSLLVVNNATTPSKVLAISKDICVFIQEKSLFIANIAITLLKPIFSPKKKIDNIDIKKTEE